MGSHGAECTRHATVWDLEAVGVPSALEALEGQHGVLACPMWLAAHRTTEEFWGGGQSPQPSGTLLAVCWGSGAGAQGSMAAATSKSPFYPEGCLTVPGS